MDAEELKRRTLQFGLRVMRVVEALPGTTAGRAIGNQLMRSGTSVGANYRASCKSRSAAEFIAKIGVAEEEADESAFWLEFIIASGLLRELAVKPLMQEAGELGKIFAQSRITARKNMRTRRKAPSQ